MSDIVVRLRTELTAAMSPHQRQLITEAAAEIERLRACHRIIAKQVGYYAADLPDHTKVDVHLGTLRAAERCAGAEPWEHPPWATLTL